MSTDETSGSDDILTREEIINADDTVYENVPVPEWSPKGAPVRSVRVKSLTGTERDKFESSMLVGTGKKQKVSTEDIRAKLCFMTIVDRDGNRLFTERDIKALGRKSAAALDRVYEVAQRLSKISDEDIEELKGNSGTGLSDD